MSLRSVQVALAESANDQSRMDDARNQVCVKVLSIFEGVSNMTFSTRMANSLEYSRKRSLDCIETLHETASLLENIVNKISRKSNDDKQSLVEIIKNQKGPPRLISVWDSETGAITPNVPFDPKLHSDQSYIITSCNPSTGRISCTPAERPIHARVNPVPAPNNVYVFDEMSGTVSVAPFDNTLHSVYAIDIVGGRRGGQWVRFDETLHRSMQNERERAHLILNRVNPHPILLPPAANEAPILGMVTIFDETNKTIFEAPFNSANHSMEPIDIIDVEHSHLKQWVRFSETRHTTAEQRKRRRKAYLLLSTTTQKK